MITNQVIQKTIDEVHGISGTAFVVADSFGNPVAETKDATVLDRAVVLDFLQSSAETLEIGNAMLFKVYDEGENAYVLAAENCEEPFLIGKLVVSQLQNLITAYKD